MSSSWQHIWISFCSFWFHHSSLKLIVSCMRLNLAGDLLWQVIGIICPLNAQRFRDVSKKQWGLSAILLLDSSLYKTVDYVLEVLTKFVSDKWVGYHVFIEQQVVSEVIYYSNNLFNQHNSFFWQTSADKITVKYWAPMDTYISETKIVFSPVISFSVLFPLSNEVPKLDSVPKSQRAEKLYILHVHRNTTHFYNCIIYKVLCFPSIFVQNVLPVLYGGNRGH